ncbi:hypothetical protein O8E88_002238 [Flavobacterium psychrophilum]|uniref:hypothetical protein n=1 Tax=Flavobacterium psychrophilum TaxID=96345 RepID=UPI0004F5ECD1|nr:hypothetical protein [Flavobacterium psychrophilum]AIN75163.1 hypothetical protein FPG3_06995 [Flavobacterium psychrophilum FPG3]EKT2070411.1 hypothetical protein [Flavobacterium psychrophilum]EKT2072885.1 hypothetical protein [Flavobacterium psychrophilum]EKT3964937.1 hypothetical protein [Flavobacterium psychrophilum]EKT4492300.1 hypothetical protein [Flavobacterium psychrophilum]
MITINKNVEYLKVDGAKIVDLNDSINEIFTELLLRIELRIEPYIFSHSAEINITGNTKEYSFSIIAEDDETAELLEKIIDEETN